MADVVARLRAYGTSPPGSGWNSDPTRKPVESRRTGTRLTPTSELAFMRAPLGAQTMICAVVYPHRAHLQPTTPLRKVRRELILLFACLECLDEIALEKDLFRTESERELVDFLHEQGLRVEHGVEHERRMGGARVEHVTKGSHGARQCGNDSDSRSNYLRTGTKSTIHHESCQKRWPGGNLLRKMKVPRRHLQIIKLHRNCNKELLQIRQTTCMSRPSYATCCRPPPHEVEHRSTANLSTSHLLRERSQAFFTSRTRRRSS